jgi:membrane-associated phospholipid phosphatase
MESTIDPLKTRSLPGHLWEKFPENWQLLDKSLQSYFESSINRNVSPWKEFQWLTEASLGISILGSFLLIFFLVSHKNESREFWQKRKKRNSSLLVILFFMGLGLSDLIAMRLKILFGRLKPHVDFYHPDYLPALSLPSNHAFNSSFLLALMIGLKKTNTTPIQSAFYIFVFFCILIVGFSRVLFGQHYPLDVFTGWLLGSILGSLYSKLIKVLLFNKSIRT